MRIIDDNIGGLYQTGVTHLIEYEMIINVIYSFCHPFASANPIVNLVILFVWGFGGGANPNKSNFAKASFIWMLIGIVLTIIFYVMFGAAMLAMMDQYSY